MSTAGRGRGRGRHSDTAATTSLNDGGSGSLLGGLLASDALDSNTTLPHSSPANRTSSSTGRGVSTRPPYPATVGVSTAASHRSDGTSNAASLATSSSDLDEYAALIAASGRGNGNDGDVDDEIGSIDQAAFARTRNLMADNAAGVQTCLVCQETLLRTDAVCQCAQCHCPFHLHCLRAWAKSKCDEQRRMRVQMPALARSHSSSASSSSSSSSPHVDAQSALSATVSAHVSAAPAAPLQWPCPSCMTVFSEQQCPTAYMCWCGKTADPLPSPWLAPHACEETCDKPLMRTLNSNGTESDTAAHHQSSFSSSSLSSSSSSSSSPACTHRCSLPCHPGPCPPCPVVVTVRCHCGAEQTRRRCGARGQVACKRVCRKVLTCSGGSSTGGTASDGDSSSHSGSGSGSGRSGKTSQQPHTCPHPCHVGPCPPCAIPAVLSCRCGKAVKRTDGKCGERDAFTCAKACGRKLACGVHYCTVVCHAGECPPCAELAKRRTCPCGKQSRVPLASASAASASSSSSKSLASAAAVPSCADLAFQAVSCGDTCDKPLVGCAHRHTCRQKCHVGACAPCQVLVSKRCRCGHMAAKAVLCSAPAPVCESKCANMRACGRHACKRKCCPTAASKSAASSASHLAATLLLSSFSGPASSSSASSSSSSDSPQQQCPPCEEICDRRLSCPDHHKCEEKCHAGECPPCARLKTLVCACGKTQRTNLPCVGIITNVNGSANNSRDGQSALKRGALSSPPSALSLACPHPCQRPSSCHHRNPAAAVAASAGTSSSQSQSDSKSHLQPSPPHAKPHPCHFGPCPPCREVCALPLSDACDHVCTRLCHSASTIEGATDAGNTHTTSTSSASSSLTKSASSPAPISSSLSSLSSSPSSLSSPSVPSVPSVSAEHPVWAARLSDADRSRHQSAAAAEKSAAQKSAAKQSDAEKSAALRKSQCGACRVLVPRQCAGGHKVFQVPCSQHPLDISLAGASSASSASSSDSSPSEATSKSGSRLESDATPIPSSASLLCGERCGRPLVCGNHTCTQLCHPPPFAVAPLAVTYVQSSLKASKSSSSSSSSSSTSTSSSRASSATSSLAIALCDTCELPCARPRPSKHCAHPCVRACHPDPCAPCAVTLKFRCPCGQVAYAYSCEQWSQWLQLAAEEPQLQSLQQHQQQQPRQILSDADATDLRRRVYEAKAKVSLACGQVCGKAMPACAHRCASVCHAGKCAPACAKTVAVVCACRAKKEEWPCDRAQSERRRQRLADEPHWLRLLPCDAATCHVAGKSFAMTTGTAAAVASGKSGSGVGHPKSDRDESDATRSSKDSTAKAGKGAISYVWLLAALSAVALAVAFAVLSRS